MKIIVLLQSGPETRNFLQIVAPRHGPLLGLMVYFPLMLIWVGMFNLTFHHSFSQFSQTMPMSDV